MLDSKPLTSTASEEKPVSGSETLSRSFGEDSIPQSHLRVVLISDILEQSGIFEDYDSLSQEIFFNKMMLFGWTEVRTLRKALAVLRGADDVPPKVALYATAILGAMSELKPEELVLLNNFEWSTDWFPTEERELCDFLLDDEE